MIRVASTEGENVNLTINVNNQPKSTGRVNNRPPSQRPSNPRRNMRPPNPRQNQRPQNNKEGNQREQQPSNQQPAPVRQNFNQNQRFSRGQKIHQRNLRISMAMLQTSLQEEEAHLQSMGVGNHLRIPRKNAEKKIANIKLQIAEVERQASAYGGVV